ncbi:TPA: SEC-C domain-containing protein [Vibrio harveyi]|nr:SEC-C domain-containing protein [Vibrio harveyi]
MKKSRVEVITQDDVERIVTPLVTDLEKRLETEKGELANDLWRELTALNINSKYIKCLDFLKKKEYRNAWNDFEVIEIAIKELEINSTTDFLKSMRIDFIQEHVKKFQALYPYCVFASPEMRVKTITCSLCGHVIKPRSRCKHKKQHLYDGKICHHIIGDVEFIGLSLVEKPVQKYSVVHDDSTLNFAQIDYLMQLLDSPFEPWTSKQTTKAYPRNMFTNVSLNAKCPCTSGKEFKDCCENKELISIPHIAFSVRNSPKKVPPDYFPH